ncbi:MAG: Asp-tRNA(Asn)/Glu-tRNA(Gln) amidotransferase subunit GatA [Candidatus Roizmanbacteria bacterium]|nr:Asp-tRNA(Asn)/Glu-tRNA(Gln) amidotransferase subunit GatA [Candidatus Roizmanbacteria bacterium]
MIKQIQKKLQTKQLSVSELVDSYLKRIESLDKKLNAFITIDREGARRRAEDLDLVLSQSKDIDKLFSKQPLFGIPIAHKDIYSTKGLETTAASNILKGYIPPYDATVVKRVYDAGAVVLGKLNCDAFAHGGTGQNSDFGPTKNPYNLEKIPGGSSSGSGAAVSADLCVVASGTDTGGSLRSPASFTNTTAIKPTYGRVPRYGIIAMASSTDSIGHITRTVTDCARYLSVTAGFDPHDATSSRSPVPDYAEGIGGGVKGMKIGIPREYMTDGVDPEIRQATETVIKTYELMGAEIVDVSLPHTEYALAVYYIVQPSEVSSNLGRFDGIRFGHPRDQFGAEAKRRIMIGTYALSTGYYDAYYLKAQKVRTLIIEDFKKAFEKVDVLLAPVSPVMPPKIGEQVNDPLKNYLMDVLVGPANLAGIPSLSVPAGFSSDGMPIGVQIMGKHFDEKTLFKTGYALEQELRLFERKPAL